MISRNKNIYEVSYLFEKILLVDKSISNVENLSFEFNSTNV